MADQTVRVSNLPDSGSPERVAKDLLNLIRANQSGKYTTKDSILDLYAECLNATSGHRKIKD